MENITCEQANLAYESGGIFLIFNDGEYIDWDVDDCEERKKAQ